MKNKNQLLLSFTLLSALSFPAHAITLAQATIIAQEEADAAAAAATAAAAAAVAEQAIRDSVFTLDDSNSITKNSTSITDNVTSNDGGAKTAILTSQAATEYGALAFKSDGSYTYTLNNNADAIVALETGESLNDLFTYQIVGENFYTASAVLTIQILGKTVGANALDETFYAFDDELSIIKGASEIAGNASSNDAGGTTYSLDSAPAGAYGTMIFATDSSFTYQLDNENPAVVALQQGSFLTETFAYTMKAFNQSVTANIVINIIGKNSSIDETFYAIDDETSIVKNSATITGGVTINDLGGISYSLEGSPIGSYGSLQFDSTGTYTYRLNNEASAVQNLTLGQFLTETFTYNMIGLDKSVSALLNIHIIGKTGSLTDIEDDVAGQINEEFVVLDDTFTIIYDSSPNVSVPTVTGNVTINDALGVLTVTLNSHAVSDYGRLDMDSVGNFTYTLNVNSSAVQELQPDKILDDTFTYTGHGFNFSSNEAMSQTATITIRILSETWSIASNVEIEPNDTTATATFVNSGQLIKGHMQSGGDRDVYKLVSKPSSVEDGSNVNQGDIIHIEICPKGENCEETQKNDLGAWVAYVFNSKFATATALDFDGVTRTLEFRQAWLRLTRDDTGADVSAPEGSNQTYLVYRFNLFNEALIGIIDPCHGNTNSVDIGTSNTVEETFYIVVSTKLLGCEGDVIQTEPGPSFVVAGETITTTQEFIVIAPLVTDQYSLSITSTSNNPSTPNALASKYTPSSRQLLIPEIRVGTELYAVELGLQSSNKRSGGSLRFDLINLSKIQEELDSNRIYATYNPENNRVKIPKYVDDYGVAFSIDLLYIPENNGQDAYLELIKMDIIE